MLPAMVTAELVLLLAWVVQSGRLDLRAGLLLIAAVCGAVVTFVQISAPRALASRQQRARFWSLVVSIGSSWIALEIGLRLAGTNATYLERSEGAGLWARYTPIASFQPSTWFHTYSSGVAFKHRRTEFAYWRYTNSFGLCEREIPDPKPADEFRVIALGDSFTEGVGTPADSTWPRALEAALVARRPGLPIAVFNGGVSGSDPWYGYVLLRDKLNPAKPDLVLVALNSSDLEDVMRRGGEERFQPDGSTRFTRQSPAWEWIYGISYVTRFVVHRLLGYNSEFLRPNEIGPAYGLATEQIVDAMRAFVRLAKESGFILVAVAHPTVWDAQQGRYDDSMGVLLERLTKVDGLTLVDVLSAWKESGVLVKHDPPSLYWPVDRHNNALGYALFGEAVANAVLRLGLVPHAVPTIDAPVAQSLAGR
jgi:lysophospholipase L1-like esterase